MRRWRAAAAAAAACALALAGASLSAPTLTPDVEALAHTTSRLSYPVFDPAGRKVRDQSWYVTDAGGNCCEVQVAATSTGRLLEFGGSFLNFSDDRGKTWQQVTPVDPRVNGEGVVSPAPGGDIVGIGWDLYTGDRLQTFKYDARSRTWSYSEAPVHSPFFDRPWLSVVPGPIVWQGSQVPYLVVVTGGYTGNVLYVSGDGLDYQPTVPLAQAAASKVSGWVPHEPHAELDYLQPHLDAYFTPLSRGVLAANPELFSPQCQSAVLGAEGTWSCFTLPSGELSPKVLMDSRGWLHQVYRPAEDLTRLTYSVSPDGGKSWRTTTLRPPRGGVIEPSFDAKVNGKRQTGAVAVRVQLGEGVEANYVFRLSLAGATPRHVETYQLGKADLVAGENLLSGGSRFDFASVAILPDGRLAASFSDKAHDPPALAVLT